MNTIYPANFEEKTGFLRIRKMLLEFCYSTLGEKQVHKIHFQTDKDKVQLLLNDAEEFRQILLSGQHFPGSDYFDPEEVFAHLRPADTYAEPETLLDLKRSLETILGIISFLGRKKEEDVLRYPGLSRHTEGLIIDHSLPGMIDSLIDEHAEVRSSASPVLGEIRREKSALSTKALRRINQIMGEGKAEGWIKKDVELALRNGRQVIPVAVAYKRKIRGFVHDHSATGQTAFLEPEEIFELNNRIRDLEFDERQEIIRLLKVFADTLRPLIPDLQKGYDMLGHMDAIRAKAKLALEMDALKPRLMDVPQLKWVNARHPLLYLSYKKQKKHVEPLTIELNREHRILVISGPNAGGKSVCLKTCGMVQYMIQCGLLVPMDNYSEAGIFNRLFIDIGDEQSLENDLSTYSSHLLNMKHLLERSDDCTLFLIDEFGTGTEPRIGGAIAEAILERLHEKGTMGVVTTHYANLKLMAGKHEGILNGSMLFDSKNMKPLYRLKTGNPGSSFAFEIGRTIGLPADILKRAADLSGDQELDFDIQLQDLDVKKTELEFKEKQLRQGDAFLSEMIDKYEKLRDELRDRKNDILIEARREAKQILAGANKIIENTIREIKESNADREKTREARKELDAYIERQSEALEKTPKPAKSKKKQKQKKVAQEQIQIESGPIGVGDAVKVKNQDTPGEVMDISGNKALVVFGNIQLRIALGELIKLKKSSVREVRAGSTKKGGMTFDINARAAAFNPDLDLRSARVDEALQKLQSHIDDAYVLGMPQIRVLHGKGDGILRPAIRNFLKDIPHVSRFRDEHPERGGAGITIIDFGK